MKIKYKDKDAEKKRDYKEALSYLCDRVTTK